MTTATQRTVVAGPTFIRLLAGLTEAEVPQTSPILSDRLSQWIDWTRAVALSRALDGRLPADGPDAPGFDSAEQDEYMRMRTSLATSISNGIELATGKLLAGEPTTSTQGNHGGAVDYQPFHQHYLDMQRSMQTTTGRLRGHLRDRLARQSADMARLAEIDAVMELSLSPREQTLLAMVPRLLGVHFQRLREPGGLDETSPPEDNQATSPGPWLEVFRNDMQSVLTAELDVRFQPIEGLLAALRAR